MWHFVGQNTQQQWLWHAMDHRSGLGCASVFGRRTDARLLHRKALWEPFGFPRMEGCQRVGWRC
jgi:insertion element IS1 protein InsB